MSPLPTATLYKPTPLERAYASHLLATHFSIPFIPPSSATTTNNTNSNEEDKIRLQGKLLVPFLTTSNIHRSTLRLLWNIVDPTNIGTLTSRRQFYILLRIIAMIQGHFLPPFDNDTTTMSDEEKMKLILNALDSNSHLVIALPTFDAVDCPSVAYLLGTYPSPTNVTDNNTSLNVDYSNFGNSGIRGSGGNNVAQQNQQQMSISDAFGSLGEVEDLPLAPLEFNNTPVLVDDGEDEDDRNTLDEGKTEEEEPAAAAIVQPQLEEEGGDEDDDEDFGNFDSVQIEEEGQLPMPLNVEQSNANDIEDEDSFGEFDHVEEEEGFTPSDGAANNAMTKQIDDDIKTESSAEEVLEKDEVQDESFGTFGDFNTVAETSQGFVDNNITEEDVSLALEGNVQTLPFENGSALGSSEPTLSVSDAFGSLVEQQRHNDEADTPLQPSAELNDGTDESFGDLNEAGLDDGATNNDDDDYDGFDTSFGHEEKVELDPFPSVDDENKNNSVERDENDNGDSNKLSVFDALVEVQDAPLPSLTAFSSPLGSADNMTEQSQPDESVKIESEPEENIMPDGEASSPTNEHPVNEHPDSEEVGFTSDVDELGTIEDPMGTNTISSGLGDADKAEDYKLQLSVFDSLTGTEDKPLPPLSSFNSANSGVDNLVPSEDTPQEDELFGDFEAPSPNILPEETDIEATAHEDDSPFDMTGQDHDVPLPSLDTLTPTIHIENDPAKDPDENKDDSNPTPPTSETQDVSTVVVKSTDFCAFQDTGESSAGQVDDNEPPKPDSNDEDMIFGDFTNNTNSLREVTSKVDGFPLTAEQVSDNLLGSHDDNNVVLPSSEPVQTEPEQNNEEEDSFGEFNAFAEASYQTDAVSSAPEPDQNNEEGASFGDFNAFAEAPEEEDNAPQVATTDDDNFGDFESTAIDQAVQAPTIIPIETDTTLPKDDDLNFGSFEGSSDIPESTNDAPPENDLGADDFGNFSSFDEGVQAVDSNNEKYDLEEILQSKLGNAYVKLAKDWQRIITSTEKDLQRGNKIMEYISSSLSSNDRLHIIKSRKLQDYLSGLGECVLLVRLITATIGDLLCIDKDIEVQESTLSQWNNNVIVANAIVIEYLWSETTAKAMENDIVLPKLESIVEIRSRSGHPLDEHQANRLCQLTLQPPVEEEGSCTQSFVMWNGKRYMASAANFCANRQIVL